MARASWWTRRFWKPKRTHEGPINGFAVGDSYCAFTLFGPTYYENDGLIVPMKSGKRALLRCTESRTPSDPGDMHFYRFEFVRYLLLAALLLTGCATNTVRVYTNGGATFVTGDALAVRAYCAAVLARVADNRGAAAGQARGCSTWSPADYARRAMIACPEGNGECISHELRHVIDPNWRHE